MRDQRMDVNRWIGEGGLMKNCREIAIAAGLCLLPCLTGCVYSGGPIVRRVWADFNTLNYPALYFEQLDHLPASNGKVEHYRWMYNQGPGKKFPPRANVGTPSGPVAPRPESDPRDRYSGEAGPARNLPPNPAPPPTHGERPSLSAPQPSHQFSSPPSLLPPSPGRGDPPLPYELLPNGRPKPRNEAEDDVQTPRTISPSTSPSPSVTRPNPSSPPTLAPAPGPAPARLPANEDLPGPFEGPRKRTPAPTPQPPPAPGAAGGPLIPPLRTAVVSSDDFDASPPFDE